MHGPSLIPRKRGKRLVEVREERVKDRIVDHARVPVSNEGQIQ